MNQNEIFNNILSECLDRILKGETVEQCLGDYPEQAKALEPLLRTAMAARVVSTIQPSPEYKAKARYEFQAALRDMANKKNKRRTFFSWHWRWQSGWAIAIVAVIAVVVAGSSTIAAASSSMPDNALYPVKLVTEHVQLAVTPSELGKAELNAEFAYRRADEIAYLASKGDAQEVQNVAQRLNTNLQNITNLAGDGGGNEAVMSALPNRSQSVAEPNPATKNDQQPKVGIAAAPAPETPAPVTAAPPMLAAPSKETGTKPSIAPATPVLTPSPSFKVAVPAPVAPPASSAEKSASGNDSSEKSRSDSNQGDQNAGNNKKLTSSDREKLKQIVINNFNARQSRLEEALKKATPQARPAVRQAIAQSQAEYDKALKTLERERNTD